MELLVVNYPGESDISITYVYMIVIVSMQFDIYSKLYFGEENDLTFYFQITHDT